MSLPHPEHRRASAALAIVAILLLAFNLRPAAVQVGPVLPQIQRDLGIGDSLAGLLTALPALCFSAFGALAPTLGRRLGNNRAVVVAAVAILAGQVARAFSPNSALFLLLSVVALAGMATANVLIPSLVKEHFPDRIGLVTACYSTSMTFGMALMGGITIPLTHVTGGWRHALALEGLTALLAVLPWVIMARNAGSHTAAGPHVPLSRVARTRLGWVMAGFFAIQSGMVYALVGWLVTIFISVGYTPGQGALNLSLFSAFGIPLAFAIPAYMSRQQRPLGVFYLLMAAGAIGVVGLMLWPRPHLLGYLWCAILAVGTASFPMILALFGMRARTHEGTAALSGFTQAVGYALAALGPLLFGVLHGWTHGWTVPLAVMGLMLIPMTVLGTIAIRSGDVEDQLPEH